jgi:methionyl aminopeptidase
VLGEDTHGHQALVDASREILQEALDAVHAGCASTRWEKSFKTVPKREDTASSKTWLAMELAVVYTKRPMKSSTITTAGNRGRFANNSVVAIETFISTQSDYTDTLEDGWTLVGEKGGFVAQHEHTLIVTEGKPVILTASNGIWE